MDIIVVKLKGVDVYRPRVLSRTPSKNEIGEAGDFVREAEARWPELKHSGMIHIPNEGVRSADQAKKMLKAGLKPGASDYIVTVPGKHHNVAYIELKKANGGNRKDIQFEFLRDGLEKGHFACMAHGWIAAIKALEKYFYG